MPKGHYGTGKVIIWDRGTYETKFWTDTKIEVTFHDKKLHREYVLRWMEKMNSWLLWKH
ncbi:DNA polymerase ligase N-terminal domain-containing protein [Chloroflexota bacterium]